MSAVRHAFDPDGIGDLPAVIPVFPLTGALLLPRAELPLNIFEPRYLDLVSDSLANGRLFGMVQPSVSRGGRETSPPLYDMGCLGRISAFQETPDGRILISLRGLCRFRVVEELETPTAYRQTRVDYSRFAGDLALPDDAGVRRETLLPMLQRYFERHKMEVDWGCIEKAPTERLVNYLAMICPFDACEKQVLLEAPTICDRARILMSLLQMPGDESQGSPGSRLQ